MKVLLAASLGLVVLISSGCGGQSLDPEKLSQQLVGSYYPGLGNIEDVVECHDGECTVVFRGNFQARCKMKSDGLIVRCGRQLTEPRFD